MDLSVFPSLEDTLRSLEVTQDQIDQFIQLYLTHLQKSSSTPVPKQVQTVRSA